jgi:putative FmdB family regulatory protein
MQLRIESANSAKEKLSVPLYEFLCKACQHRFEKIQKFSDPMPDECPACGEDAVEQMLSAPAVQFKGSGWYVTDYAKKTSSQGSAGKASDVKAESKSDSGSEKKTDSKPKD